MAMIIDPNTKLFILDSDSFDIESGWNDWCAWLIQDNNLGYLQALRCVGGDVTDPGQKMPITYFLMNGWRIRPREANHVLVISGFVKVDGGGNPFAPTLGNYNVVIRWRDPFMAISYDSAGTPAPTAEEIVAAIIAAGIGQGTGNLTTEQNDQLMNRVATKNDLFII